MEVGDTALSGIVAEPDGEPRALVMAIHGAGMHAGYFDATAAPGLSLLDLGRRLGFTVWAPDRPGVGASADLPDDRIVLFPQAELLLNALDEFAMSHATGAGVLLVGHSYGLKVALTMAASERGRRLLGLDGAGSGIRYAHPWEGGPGRVEKGDRGVSWGPAALYPDATFRRGAVPLATMPKAQAAEGGRWPDDFRGFGERITIPVRFTWGEHERFWPTDPSHQAEVRAALPNVPSIGFAIEPGVGHNVSLGWVAPSYHLQVLAFAERCMVARSTGAAATLRETISP